jgi:thiol:disulfide interchange protein
MKFKFENFLFNQFYFTSFVLANLSFITSLNKTKTKTKKKMTRFFLLLLPFFVFSQIQKPVKWSYSINSVSGQSAEIVLQAKIDKGWHLYSKDISQDSGVPTKITFSNNKSLKLIGKTQEEGKLIEKYSEVFATNLKYYNDKVIYKQKINWEKPLTEIEVEVEFQVCDDRVCLTPDVEILIIPLTQNLNLTKKNTENTSNSTAKIASIDLENPLTKNCIQEKTDDKSLITIILLGFFGGLLALLTPCVFPMIPLTVTYFTKSKQKKDALIYAFFILLIFLSLSIPFYLMEGIVADVFNQISTNIWVNLSFFVIFVFFAFSLFGYYEIALPNSLANRTDKAADGGGVLGIFFLALTLVIVSFSCTGPILGSLLVGAIDNANGAEKLTAALGGFGLSWALVFGGLSLFPSLLSKLPKSGGWLNTIKVSLGFVELAMALKFLSKADLVAKTHFISREIFVLVWILIFVGLILVLLNLIKIPNSDLQNNLKKIILVISILFVIYLSLGITKLNIFNLNELSGLLPPAHLSQKSETTKNDCPLGLACYNDYEEAVEIAKKTNKPLFIDFTGWGCENCRRMEEIVWVDEKVYSYLKNEVVVASLYIDDSQLLPSKEQKQILLSNGNKRKIKTVGNKWSVFQAENFNSNSQPQYVLLTPNEELINYPIAGYRSKEEFLEFLACGITYYKK